jgi:hypothetical protein
MGETSRFQVTRTDVNLILAELAEKPQPLLYAPLMEALLAGAAALDSDASQPNTGHQQTTVLPLTGEYAPFFRRWLQAAAIRARACAARDEVRAQAFDGIRCSG